MSLISHNVRYTGRESESRVEPIKANFALPQFFINILALSRLRRKVLVICDNVRYRTGTCILYSIGSDSKSRTSGVRRNFSGGGGGWEQWVGDLRKGTYLP